MFTPGGGKCINRNSVYSLMNRDMKNELTEVGSNVTISYIKRMMLYVCL